MSSCSLSFWSLSPKRVEALAVVLYQHAGRKVFVIGVNVGKSGRRPRRSLAYQVRRRVRFSPERKEPVDGFDILAKWSSRLFCSPKDTPPPWDDDPLLKQRPWPMMWMERCRGRPIKSWRPWDTINVLGKKGSRILCLDGGGSRGMTSVTAMDCFVKSLWGAEVVDCFDLVAGTSVWVPVLSFFWGWNERRVKKLSSSTMSWFKRFLKKYFLEQSLEQSLVVYNRFL
jgi:hypothetical protein